MANPKATPLTFNPIHIAQHGTDKSPGTRDAPLATLAAARDRLRQAVTSANQPRRVLLHSGTYYLPEPFQLDPRDSGTAESPVIYQAAPGERVTISGARRLSCQWRPFRDGIFVCDLPEAADGSLDFTQLFADGIRQIRARYPNDEPTADGRDTGYAYPIDTIAPDVADPCPDRDRDMTYDCEPARGIVFDPEFFTAKQWARPWEAVIHIFQFAGWGNLQWHVKTVDHEKNHIWFGEGGHQMGAKWSVDGARINGKSRFYIENVFEELDAPKEWYLDKQAGKLYWMPEAGVDPNRAIIEVPRLKTLIRLEGTRLKSVEHVAFEGIRFAHTETTFFERYEIPSLGDWALHRGGALRLEGTRGCDIRDCLFEGLGGNAVFANGFNRGLTVRGGTFRDVGDSGVLLVGEFETTTGTQKHFPYECRVENNYFHDLGRFGKQTAAVYISRAKRVTVGHNLIHHLPRAGICIGDGTWGGHVIEYNHIHDTCLETLDHGPFNAWGRDRTWSAVHGQSKMLKSRCIDAAHSTSDAMETVILRHNFFVEKHGWGLDLDDGATNYDIYNNICVGVGMKLREGSYRTIHNNIWVNCASSPCFHVGNEDNHDRYVNNITVMSPSYQEENHDRLFNQVATGNEIYYLVFPPVRTPWLEQIDYNCFHNDLGRFIARVKERESTERRDIELAEWQAMGFDRHSVFADPMFVDPDNNDFRVKPESPALKVGFKNFNMGLWGLTDEFPKSWWD
ncbi:MAG: right-handed parallel beta-helix repeat-containing protein [Lentisphaeria bacterium]|nr:right-handed parallel beta-helix repeat-containing protein [Lentisphaeria bacterium]